MMESLKQPSGFKMPSWHNADKAVLHLSKPYIPAQSFDIVKKILHSGNLIQGENVMEFERLLSEYLGIEHVVLVSSGTAALHLALVALDIAPGDEVIVPAFSFPAVANVVELVGAKPVFVDITLDDYCIDVSKIEENISQHTKAIIPVHEFGQSADVLEIMRIARKHNLFVIEDAACAIGTKFNSVSVGTFGDLGCFSFHPRKILTTGEGGAIITTQKSYADRIRKLRNHGMHKVDGKIDFVLPGFNYRMTDFQAGIGHSQLSSLDETIGIHRVQAEYYNHAFAKTSAVRLDVNYENRFKTYQTYHLLLDSKIPRDAVKDELLKFGIESNIGAYAIPALSYYQSKYSLPLQDFENACIGHWHGLALPIGRHLGSADLTRVVDSFNEILSRGF